VQDEFSKKQRLSEFLARTAKNAAWTIGWDTTVCLVEKREVFLTKSLSDYTFPARENLSYLGLFISFKLIQEDFFLIILSSSFM